MATRGAKVGISFLVVALLLGGVLLVADRVAASAAEDQIAKQTKSELDARSVKTPSEPAVSIAGFPFLTQVVAGEYEKISIVIERPDLNGVQLSELRIDARTVRAEARAVMNGTGEVIADKVSGTATIAWDEVQPLLELAGLPTAGLDLSTIRLRVIDNQAEIRVPLLIEGVRATIIGTGTVVVESGKVRLQLKDVKTDVGQVPAFVQSLIRRYQQNLAVAIKIPELPFNLTINKVETSDAGLLIIATADRVSLAQAT